MKSLPVIVGLGGVNAAGRSSFHHAFLRLVYDVLPAAERDKVRRSLGQLMGIGPDTPAALAEERILRHTLVRTIEPEWFDTARIYRHARIEAAAGSGPLCWTMAEDALPSQLPPGWRVARGEGGRVEVSVAERATFYVPDYESYSVRAAGQLPTGFHPGAKYPSKGHPRGLQLAVYGASDAVRSVGLAWPDLLARVPGDQVAVYASSAMGQLDWEGGGGMLQSALLGKHTTSRNCPLSLTQMPADFVNAYVIGSIGRTGGLIGACATFLYNLEKAVQDMQAGIVRLAMVGAAEAPILPEVLEGYRAMSALAEDPDLLELEGRTEGEPDHRRACRPFGPNCGFAMGESAQYLVLMDGELALEQGATILGSVPGVFIHADGPKRSISSPGIGNYLTVGKACALAAKILGERGLRERSFVHAHGAGTPQNRVTESHVLDRIAAAFDIRDWAVTTAKCFVGHSLGPAAGDQTAFALGTLALGWVPGIVTVDELATDIHDERLSLSNRHRQYPADHWQAALVNSKGFGGNNATGIVLSPERTEKLLVQGFGADALRTWRGRNEAVRARQQQYEDALLSGHDEPIYDLRAAALEGAELTVGRTEIRVPGFPLPVGLDVDNPYGCIA
ncbi:MAG: beta-ketoacyl synthase [Deltaproteobacteria bacterium]|nr:beta-ketoacyl synthase [Deltaproteobacteria bacterium]